MRSIVPILALSALLSGCVDLPGSDRKQSSVRNSTTVFSSSPSARQCLAELGSTRADFTPKPDRYASGGCSALNTVSLSSVMSDHRPVATTNLSSVGCPAATTFAGWARYGVDRAARQILGSPLARIETFGSYNCRNVAGTSRRSAHATAAAIDVSAFVLRDGRRITVLDGWNGSSSERQFLRVVHQSACKRFGTVLGPNYNRAHANHFHLEAKSGSFCR
ncbi:MAG: extensin family protein [Sphingomonadaceae bacterium]|jgi:hypothetical protein